MFELRLNNKTILLNWGTLAMRLFTTKNNTDISGYFDLMAKAGTDINTLVSLVHCGYEAACIKNNQPIEYNENDVCDWIDDMGGIGGTKFQEIMAALSESMNSGIEQPGSTSTEAGEEKKN